MIERCVEDIFYCDFDSEHLLREIKKHEERKFSYAVLPFTLRQKVCPTTH